MPSIVDKHTIKNKGLDKRIKLTEEDKAEIRKIYPKLSLRQLADKYNVNKRTIQFVLYPERAIQAKKNWDWKKFYNKEKHRISTAKHRQYKKELLEKGLIS